MKVPALLLQACRGLCAGIRNDERLLRRQWNLWTRFENCASKIFHGRQHLRGSSKSRMAITRQIIKHVSLRTFLKDVVSDSNRSYLSAQKLCPIIPPNLVGYIPTKMDIQSLDDVEGEFPDVMPGGHFRPKECTSRHRVAILIPYRNRAEHLKIFIYNIHRVLARQQIDYGVFVIEQGDSKGFNRAKLLNIGYLESTALYDYQCFVFHDIDLVPVDDRNVYTCPQRPRHMSVTIDSHSGVPYYLMFGGVSALNKELMLRVNGYSNIYWGWGGEDDDMTFRLKHINQTILRRPGNIARYKSLKHTQSKKNPARFGILNKWKERLQD
ncbi:hypothetical protein MTO96_023676 [Rhipicephalus appendiculatus]